MEALGVLIVYAIVGSVLFFGWRYTTKVIEERKATDEEREQESRRVKARTRVYAYSDLDGPNQGLDPEVVESGKRRAQGIE